MGTGWAAPDFMDTELGHLCGFKLHRADIAQSLMEPLSIVEHFDEFKHCRLGLLAGQEVLIMNQLILQCTEEALDHRIVIAIALATPSASF